MIHPHQSEGCFYLLIFTKTSDWLLLQGLLIRCFSCICTQKILSARNKGGTDTVESIKCLFELAFNKCASPCSSFPYIIQCLVSGMWVTLREQGSSFISYWAIFISEALIRRSADICSDWEAYEESFVKTQRTTAMSSLVHLSSFPVTGCLDMLYVLSFLELFGEKWTSEASVETVATFTWT